ncbi:MAG: BatA domain-containing protein, partial [Planctomycetota bacterium]
ERPKPSLPHSRGGRDRTRQFAMAFVNLSLLLGTLLIGIPIALHLAMRRKPRKLKFPALRFIQQHQAANRRRLRLRHWLLLLLRCLLLALAALALARPSVASNVFGNWLVVGTLSLLLILVGLLFFVGLFTQQSKLLLTALGGLAAGVLAALLFTLIGTLQASEGLRIGDREAPVAAVMVFDSSPRMRYRQNNQTRLELARETANWMIGQLPPESRVAVLDSRAITPSFSVSMGAARRTVQRVKSTGAPRPLDRLLETALQLLRRSRLKRKEIYVYTDLTAAAWQIDDADRLRRKFEQAAEVSVYLIDVGTETPRNFSLGDLELSEQTVSKNGQLTISTTISCIGSGGKRAVTLYVEDVDPTLPIVRNDEVIVPESRVHSRQEVTLDEGDSEQIEFVLSSQSPGMRHATIRIDAQDALSSDNTRFLSVKVREPWQVLVAAPSQVNTSAFVEAVAPYEQRTAGQAIHDCTTITPTELPTQALDDFAVVVLIDPTPLPAATWEQLGTYVRGGGQLALFLGHHAGEGDAFNTPEALELMPGELGRQYRVSGRGVFLAPHSYDHPILQKFRPIASSVPWDQFPVFRYWNIPRRAPNTQVILRFGSNRPALLERPVGEGTVLTLTTPITEPERPAGRAAWNELAGPNDWPRFILVNEIVRYLSQHGTGTYNFETGQTVHLPSTSEAVNRYLLFLPEGNTQRVQARDGQLTIKTTDSPGTYRLKGDGQQQGAGGFSVNLPARAGRLERTTKEHLDERLGKNRYQLAHDRTQIEREQGHQRSGREFYSLLIAVLAVVLILEHLLANRFYRDTQTAPAAKGIFRRASAQRRDGAGGMDFQRDTSDRQRYNAS